MRKLTTGWLIAMLVVAAAFLSFAPVRAQSEPYVEDFNDGEAQGWRLNPDAWFVTETNLVGQGPGDATYAAGQYGDLDFSFDVNNISGTAAVFFRQGDGTGYVLIIFNSGGIVSLQLIRGSPGSDFINLGEANFTNTSGDAGSVGPFVVEIIATGDEIAVFLDKKQYISAVDSDPLPPGLLGFQNFAQSFVVIDNVIIWDTTAQEEPPPQPVDLAITGMRASTSGDDPVTVLIDVDVANVGNVESPQIDLLVYAEDEPDYSDAVSVGPIAPGDVQTFSLSIDSPAEWADTTHRFVGEVRSSEMGLANLRDDIFFSDPVLIPGSGGTTTGTVVEPPPEVIVPVGPSAADRLTLFGVVAVIGAVGVAVLGGTAFMLRRASLGVGRARWEKQATPHDPPDSCQPPGYHCKVETGLEYKLMKVASLELSLSDPDAQSKRLAHSIEHDLPGALQQAIYAHFMREQEDRFADRIDRIARELAAEIYAFIAREKNPVDVSVGARLEGIEMTLTFTLFKCVGSRWQQTAQWEKSKPYRREDDVASISGIDAGLTSLERRLTAELVPMVRRYVEGYQIKQLVE